MDLRQQLLLEHQDVENSLEQMKFAVRRDDPRGLCEAWSRFERDLGDHLRFEERELLCRFAEVDPAEAAALRDEHDRIRKLVAELGISADLHTMRATVADQLLEELRAHGRREDAKLYPWALETLPAHALEGFHCERIRQEIARRIDELRLKMHLLQMEARDELTEIEHEAWRLVREAKQANHERHEALLARLRRLAAPLD